MASIEKHALDRWMYRMSGMDYGPFSTKDILDFVIARQIDEDTELRSHKSRNWMRLGDIPAFKEYIDELRQRERKKKQEQQLEESVMRVQRTLTKGRRASWILLVAFAAIVGGGSYFFLLPAEPTGSDLSFDVFTDLSLKRLPLVQATIASPPPKKPKHTPSRTKSVKRKWSGGSAMKDAGAVAAAMPPAPEVNLSFDSEDLSDGRKLTRGDLDSIQKKATPRLIRCFRKEAGSDPDFSGGVVTLYILTSGRVTLSRLDTRPGPSQALMDCTRIAVSGLWVPPFAGANQVMRLPLHVAGVR